MDSVPDPSTKLSPKTLIHNYAGKHGLHLVFLTKEAVLSTKPVFKSAVFLEKRKFPDTDYFPTRKSAEKRASELALEEIDREEAVLPPAENYLKLINFNSLATKLPIIQYTTPQHFVILDLESCPGEGELVSRIREFFDDILVIIGVIPKFSLLKLPDLITLRCNSGIPGAVSHCITIMVGRILMINSYHRITIITGGDFGKIMEDYGEGRIDCRPSLIYLLPEKRR
jgi:hypothetical protein